MGTRFAAVVLAICAPALAQEAPKVVSLEPANGAEVDAKKTTRLVVVFDRKMAKGSHSFCGGGDTFPKFASPPKWEDDRVVVEVELQPDREYHIGLNAPSFRSFRSADGVPLAPVQWTFTTLPAKTRPAAEQKQRNKQALALLMKELPARYSYYDLRVADWGKLEKQHAPAILAARTDRGFASAVGEMLRATEDVHVWLKLGEQTFAGGRRAVDPLFRREQIDRHVRVAPVGTQALAGRTGDGIGYLMIGAWTREVDPDAIGRAITELADTRALVVDVRPNSGGDEGIAQRVAAWFVDGTKTYAKNRYRERPGKDGFGQVFERKLTGNPPERRYDKPIAVLTSRYVMSSNESFVMMLQQARDCTVVGQPTFGCSGNPKPCELSNGVVVWLPSWQDLRLDGTPFEGEGLKPDVEVPCTPADLEQGDPILAKALELLRAKVADK
jgi:hypothetical protein